MNRSIKPANFVAILLLLGTVFSVTSAVAQQQPFYSSNKQATQWFGWGSKGVNLTSLYGWYGLLIAGPSSTPGAGGKYLTGAIYFNGIGGLAGYNVNGGSNGQVGNTSVTGTYAVNSDSTITIALNLKGQSAAQTYVVGVRQTSFEAVGIETDGSAIATIDLQSQYLFWNFPYNNASLSGTFSAQLNYVSFDGKGNLSGVDPYDDNNMLGTSPFSGTYTVSSDGTFSAVTAPSVSITGVIDNFNTEIEYTFNVAGQGEIISCVGKK
jgi:hypothetical protein